MLIRMGETVNGIAAVVLAPLPQVPSGFIRVAKEVAYRLPPPEAVPALPAARTRAHQAAVILPRTLYQDL